MALLNDYKWFNELYENKKRLVFKLINGQLQNPDDADDISQIVWEKVFKYRKRLRNPETKAVNYYLKEVVRTTIADYYKGAVKEEIGIYEYGKVIQVDSTTTDFETNYDEVLDTALYNAMQKLSSEEKSLIYLTYYEKRKSSDIAELLGISDSLVRMRLTKVRRLLREVIEEIIEEENADA